MQLVTATELALAWGVIPRRISKCRQRGMPAIKHGREWRFDLEACNEWRRLNRSGSGGKRSGAGRKKAVAPPIGGAAIPSPPAATPTELPAREISERKILDFKAQVAELELKQKLGELLHRDDVRSSWTRRLMRMERHLAVRGKRFSQRISVTLGLSVEQSRTIHAALEQDTAESIAMARENKYEGEAGTETTPESGRPARRGVVRRSPAARADAG